MRIIRNRLRRERTHADKTVGDLRYSRGVRWDYVARRKAWVCFQFPLMVRVTSDRVAEYCLLDGNDKAVKAGAGKITASRGAIRDNHDRAFHSAALSAMKLYRDSLLLKLSPLLQRLYPSHLTLDKLPGMMTGD